MGLRCLSSVLRWKCYIHLFVVTRLAPVFCLFVTKFPPGVSALPLEHTCLYPRWFPGFGDYSALPPAMSILLHLARHSPTEYKGETFGNAVCLHVRIIFWDWSSFRNMTFRKLVSFHCSCSGTSQVTWICVDPSCGSYRATLLRQLWRHVSWKYAICCEVEIGFLNNIWLIFMMQIYKKGVFYGSDGLNLDLREMGCVGGRWMELAQDRVQWRTVVLAAVNFLVLYQRIGDNNTRIPEHWQSTWGMRTPGCMWDILGCTQTHLTGYVKLKINHFVINTE
jgi:hypothetical protein